MAKRADITPELCRQLLRYEPETGKMYWKERESKWFSDAKGRWGGVHTAAAQAKTWNARYAETEAFTASGEDGYLRGAILGKSFLAHRIAWAIFYGEWPTDEIDHANMDRTDNREANLRSADHSENNCNRSIQSNNTSGLKGVSWHKAGKKWRAHIVLHGKQKHLGLFNTREAAYSAYLDAVDEMHGIFARVG